MREPGRFRAAFTLVAAAFDALDIPYCIAGSLASTHYGTPRGTIDVDVVADIAPAQVGPLCRALEPRFYVSEDAARSAVRRRASFNVIHTDSSLKVDIFVLGATPYDRASFARRRRERTSLLGPCVLPTPEDALLAKLLWYEKGGRASERQWADCLGIVGSQGERLDMEYLDSWARRLGIADILGAVLRETEAPGAPPPPPC